MTLTNVCEVSFVAAAIPAVLFCWNLLFYREPPQAPSSTYETARPKISVLIPARNEEASIGAAIESVLRSQGVDLELVILDDASTDRTAKIVEVIRARDSRVRLEHSSLLPEGWNGKQYACSRLAQHARYDVFCFLDADVRVAPAALARMHAFMGRSKSDLVSGFPRQETETALEWLLLPLIHFVLLGFLPLVGMRVFRVSGFAAGCGQFMMLRREGYELSGGHASIRSTMHDGLLLPRSFRRKGLRTDLADLTELASCRMYRSAGEVWSGLSKNATEGLAAPARILPFSFLLFFGQVIPVLLLLLLTLSKQLQTTAGLYSIGAVVLSYLPRALGIVRFRQRFVGALLHPVGVLLLLVLEWWALARKIAGRQSTWKQRAYDAG
jgi:glycosyltransferase involved in cell wall biosynthesis